MKKCIIGTAAIWKEYFSIFSVILLLLSASNTVAQRSAIERLTAPAGGEFTVRLASTNVLVEMDLSGAAQQLVESTTNRAEIIFLNVPEARWSEKRTPNWQVYLCGVRDAESARTVSRQSVGWMCSNTNSAFYIGELRFSDDGIFRKGKTGRGAFAIHKIILDSIIDSDGKAVVTFISNYAVDVEQLAKAPVTLSDLHFIVQRAKVGSSSNPKKP